MTSPVKGLAMRNIVVDPLCTETLFAVTLPVRKVPNSRTARQDRYGCRVLRSIEERLMLFRSPQWAGVRSDPSFSTVEVALLRCFGLDQHAQRSHEALRAALIDAGQLLAQPVPSFAVALCSSACPGATTASGRRSSSSPDRPPRGNRRSSSRPRPAQRRRGRSHRRWAGRGRGGGPTGTDSPDSRDPGRKGLPSPAGTAAAFGAVYR